MKTSRLAVFHSKDEPIAFEKVTIPALGPGEILVRNEYTTLCRSDLNTFAGKRTEKTPTILGHEIVGCIDELGPGAPTHDCRGAPLQVGDRVTWAIYASDPASVLAQRGIPQKGEGLFKYGHERITATSTLHGGLAEYCILRRHTPIVRVPLSIPLPVVALINCSVATVAGSLRVAGEIRNRDILIAGTGMLGVIACAMCRLAGARRIVALDVAPDRLETALRFGADLGFDLRMPGSGGRDGLAALAGDHPFTVALDYSGIPETMELLLASLGIGGFAVWVGATYPQRPLAVEAESLVRRLLTVTGLHNYNERDLVTAVEFVEQHHTRFPLVDLVHDGFDLHQTNEAFACALASRAHRVGVRIRIPPA